MVLRFHREPRARTTGTALAAGITGATLAAAITSAALAAVITIATLFVLPGLAAAQSEVTFQIVDVDLWPEYDRPAMLVIYKVTLAPEVELPAAVNFRIPAAAGDPNAVAVRQPDGQLFSTAYERRELDEWATVSFVATTRGFQLEYYDPALALGAPDRSFTFTWPADYQARSLAVEVQQPLGARDLRTTPTAASTSTSAEGFAYKHVPLGARLAGDEVEVTIEYVKEGDTLSVQAMAPAPTAPQTSPSTVPPSGARSGSGFPTLQVFGALAVVLIVGAALLWWRPRKQEDRAAASAGRQSPPEGGSTFCTQCGTPAAEGDRFCHSCGTPLPGD